MKYFLIGTDEKNRIPYNINKNRAVDVRTLTREGIGTLPMWNIIGMDLPDEGFFPDLICSPFVLMSENCIKTAVMSTRSGTGSPGWCWTGTGSAGTPCSA